MSLTTDLKDTYHDLWTQMVHHPFVVEMGEGTLPEATFKTYFLQDYVFVRDLVSLTALGISKAPDFVSASRLNQFLSGILNPENDLFVRAFKQFGVPQQEYLSATASPTTQAFGDYLLRVGLQGDFDAIMTVLYVTEGTYLDWGTRLLEAGKSPQNPIYQEWIDIHGPAVLGDLVAWMQAHLDALDPGPRRREIERHFLTTLRYEYRFWEAAYHGERWPDE